MSNCRYNTSNTMRQTGRGNRPSSAVRVPRMEMPQDVCCDDKAEYDELSGMPIAMAYVPWQEWRAVYEAEKGFHRGTIFEELDKPFMGREVVTDDRKQTIPQRIT